MADRSAEALVALASGLRFDDLPQATVHAAKRLLVDSMGCALGALRRPEVLCLRPLAGDLSPARPVSVFGWSTRTTAEWAALLNGALIRCRDFNDDYFGGTGDLGPHPSDTLGAVLAAAESSSGDGRAVVEGMVIAYETMARLVDQIVADGRNRTWDYTVLHAAGSALATGRIMGLSSTQLRNALGIAVVSNVSLYQTRAGQLSNWKTFAGPEASRGGLVAAQLAGCGITGPSEPIEGKAGLGALLGCPLDLGGLRSRPTSYKIESAYFKSLPVRYTNQLAAHIAMAAHPEVPVGAVDTVTVFGIARDVVSKERHPEQWVPTTRETADHSLPYLVAAALLRGDIDEATFTPASLGDPVILNLADRITVEEDPAYTAVFPRTFRCRIEVVLTTGAKLSFQQDNPKGHPDNPLSDHELEAKFMAQVDGQVPAPRARQVLDQLWAIDEADTLGPLMRTLRDC